MSDPAALFTRIAELEQTVTKYRQVLSKAQGILLESPDTYYATKVVSKMIEETLRLTPTSRPGSST